MWGRIGSEEFRAAAEVARGSGDRTGNWSVCDEYVLQDGAIVAVYGHEGDDQDYWRVYLPLEQEPDLFLKFARLWEEPDFETTALDFAHSYGLPRDSEPDELTPFDADANRMEIPEFYEQSRRAGVVLSLCEAVLNENVQAARQLLETEYGDRVLDKLLYSAVQTKDSDMMGRALLRAAHIVSLHVSQGCYLDLGISRELPEKVSLSWLKVAWGFRDLLSAMYLQMYWILTSEGELARCEYCGRIMSLSRPRPDATKRRNDRRFCDDACRQAAHRSRKRHHKEAL